MWSRQTGSWPLCGPVWSGLCKTIPENFRAGGADCASGPSFPAKVCGNGKKIVKNMGETYCQRR